MLECRIAIGSADINPWGGVPPWSPYAVIPSCLWKDPQRIEFRRGFFLRDLAAKFCQAKGITVAELKGPCKKQAMSLLRHEFMALAHESGAVSYPAIGRFLGNRDHTTVMYGARAHRARQP